MVEGDWTHLTVEDFNHLGQYKVEYKVTGKNKFDKTLKPTSANCTIISNNDGLVTVEVKSKSYPSIIYDLTARLHEFNNSQWKCSATFDIPEGFLAHVYLEGKDLDGNTIYYANPNSGHTIRTERLSSLKMRVVFHNKSEAVAATCSVSNIQIEKCEDYPTFTATPYEPYKEYTKTFYLNSPLLEGDTIEDINGVATHVKRYGKVVLDGSEDEGWKKSGYTVEGCSGFYIDKPNNFNDEYICDNFTIKSFDDWSEGLASEFICSGNTDINIRILSTKLSSQDAEGFKAWLQANPTTAVYELASPIYEPISTESILCDSYVKGHLDFDSAVPVEKVEFRNTNGFPLKYAIPYTKYILKFESDSEGYLDSSWLGGAEVGISPVHKGLNIRHTTTKDRVNPWLTLAGIGFNASNVQVVATDRDNIKYFKGMESSFEDKVIRNKNLFNKNNVIFNNVINENGEIIYNTSYCRTEFIECKPNTPYTCNAGTGIHYFDENRAWIGYRNHGTLSPSNAKYLIKCIDIGTDLDIVQIEEGIESTTYEEYNIYNGKYEVKITLEDENGVISNESIYLNSPLLKGDRIEMYNGKLCHYHKMGKVVLDGSEDWLCHKLSGHKHYQYYISDNISCVLSRETINCVCDTKKSSYLTNRTYESDFIWCSGTNLAYVSTSEDLKLAEWKQWLQANPTTVVYELAEPYYEEITPEHNEFTIVSIGESSFTIDSGNVPTDSEVTYNVNVKLLNDLEENMNNNTSSTNVDLTTILDDIINE
jgi:hypothetical protein